MKYTVTWKATAQARLAELWRTNPKVREDIRIASDYIDRRLQDDPHTAGIQLSPKWRQVVMPPLTILFSIADDDRLVNVSHVKFWDE